MEIVMPFPATRKNLEDYSFPSFRELPGSHQTCKAIPEVEMAWKGKTAGPYSLPAGKQKLEARMGHQKGEG